MRKVFPKIAGFALYCAGIVIILGACVKPVDVEDYLNSSKVQEIIKDDEPGVGIHFTIPEITNYSPVLEWSNPAAAASGILNNGDILTVTVGADITLTKNEPNTGGTSPPTVTIGDGNAIYIKASMNSGYSPIEYNEIQWYWNLEDAPITDTDTILSDDIDNDTLQLDPANLGEPFKLLDGYYSIMAVGTVNGVLYSTHFYVLVKS